MVAITEIIHSAEGAESIDTLDAYRKEIIAERQALSRSGDRDGRSKHRGDELRRLNILLALKCHGIIK